MKYFCLILVISVLSFSSGCSWVGKTAGQAEANIEKQIDNTKQGYREGYSSEKERLNK